MGPFEFLGLRVFPSPGELQSYLFVPTLPDLRRDANGKPMTSVFDVGSAGYVMLCATWDADARDLEALRNELATRAHEQQPGCIRLSFAPMASIRCNALIGNGSGSFQVASTSTTSRVPPYDALFNLCLQDERLTCAKAALRGEQGALGIEYLADLLLPVSVKATFDAEAERLIPWLKSRGMGDILELLELAVEDGVATVAVEVPDHQASEFSVALYERVLARAAEMMARWLTEDPPVHLHVTVTLGENAIQAVRAFADVGVIVSRAPAGAAIGG